LQSLKSGENKVQTELLTGKKVNTLEDDASLANTLLVSQSDRERLVQYNTNAKLSDNIAEAGVDALGHIGDENALALSIAEDDTVDGAAAATRIDAIIEDVLATANTKYGDDYLFAGSASGSGTAPFTYDSAQGKYVYNGSGDGRSIEVSDGATVSPFASSDDNQAILDSLNSMLSLRNALSGDDDTAKSSAMAALQTADDNVTASQSDLSMVQYRLEILTERNSAKYSLYDTAQDTATKADENESTVKLLAYQNAYTAALQSASKIMSQTLLDYV
jgi:flagellar hook-associated protein 3 FlgL